MATKITCTVDKGGTGNYLTLNAAEAANFGASSANLVTANEYVECTLICTNGAADTTATTVSGQTTDSSHTILITVGTGYRHDGTYPASGNIYTLTASADPLLGVYGPDYVTIDGLALKSTATIDSSTLYFHTDAGYCEIKNCVIDGTGAAHNKAVYGFYANCTSTTGTTKISNCIVYGFDGTGHIGLCRGNTGTVYCNNNTVVGNTTGISASSTNWIVKNCISVSNTTDWTSAFNSGSTNNIGGTASGLAFGATRTTGTTSGSATGKLIDATKNFTALGVRVGTVVKNTTDTTYSYVTAVDSTTQLSLNDNIMASSENYSLYYNLFGAPTFQASGSNDYHLVAGSANIAYQTGADLDGDTYPITLDIDGQSRNSSTPCIGADECVDYDATGHIALGKIALDGACTRAHEWDAPGGITLGKVAVDGAAFRTIPSLDATGHISLGAISVRGNATLVQRGTGGITLPALALSGDATYAASTKIIKKRVDPDNGTGTHYTSLAAWEAAFGGVPGSGNLVGNDKIAVAECYCSGGTADTSGFTLSGWTATDATHYIKITVAEGYRHKGVFPASGNIYRLNVTSGTFAFRIYSTDNVIVEWLAGKFTASADYGQTFQNRDAENVVWKNCVATVNANGKSYIRCFNDYYNSAGATAYINCLAYGSTGTAGECFWVQNRTGGTLHYYHCGAAGRCGINGTSNSGCTATVRNCYAKTTSTSFTGVTFTGSSYNAYSSGGDPGTNGIDISGEAEGDLFVTAASNYHILKTGALYNVCPTLYYDSLYPVQTDFHGFPRPGTGTVDCGPHEYASATGHATLPGCVVSGLAASIGRDSTGAIVLPAVDLRGIVTLASAPQTWNATGDVTLGSLQIDGHAGKRNDVTGNINLGVLTTRGLVMQVMPSPEFPTTLHGYEVWPLSPELAVVETQVYRVIQTDADSPTTLTRAISDKVLRRWRVKWDQATESESQIVRGFIRDVRGTALPFWFDVVDTIARPYDGPTLSTSAGGSLGGRTYYVRYTWASGNEETTESYEESILMVPSGELLSVAVPNLPQNVAQANIYVGITTDALKKQVTPITNDSLTWTEPITGYEATGSGPPTVNSLSERVLVHFADNGLTITRKSATRYEIQTEFEELWVQNPRAYFATGAIELGAMTVVAPATLSAIKAAGTIDLPALSVSGVATIAPSEDTFMATGHITLPAITSSGDAANLEPGTYYVAKTGSDSNPGSAASPFLTIQHAVTAASTGDTIVVQAGTYAENVAIDAEITLIGNGRPIISGTGDCGITASGIDNVSISGFSITGQKYGIYETGGDNWTINDVRVYSQTTGGIYLKGSKNSSYVYSAGNGMTVSNCAIYQVGNVDNAFGIGLEDCCASTVSGNQVYLIHRECIRDVGGEANTIQSNWCQMAYVGVKVGIGTTDAYVYNNQIDYCQTGIAFEGCTGRVSKNEAYKNTCYYCCTAANLGFYYAGTDYCDCTYNMWKHSGDRHVYYQESNLGSHNRVDFNLYWDSGERPTVMWQGSATSYDAISDVRTNVSQEASGIAYACGSTSGYGASGVTKTEPAWTTVAMTATSASHNEDTARRSVDFKILTTWGSGAGNNANEWVVFDFGSTQSFQYACLFTYGDNAEHTPKTFRIDTSPDASTWTTRLSGTNTWGGGCKWFALGSPVSCRYVRLYLLTKFTTDDLTWTDDEFRFGEFIVGILATAGAITVSSVSTSWQRGQVYQLAPGAYGTLNFTTPVSGTDYVEIRGGTGVTVEKVSMASSYLKLVNLDIYNTSDATSTPYLVDLVASVHHLYMSGCTIRRPANTYLGRGVYATRGGNTNLVFEDCIFRDLWGPFYYGIDDTDITFDGCEFRRNYSNSTTHSEGIDLNNTTRCTIRNCWLEDITGTAFIVALNKPCNYIYVYNNIFHHTVGASFSTGHGTISDNTEASKSATSHYVYVYHNTFVTVADYSGRSGVTFWFGDNVFARNNLFYACKKMAMLGVDDDYTAAYDCPASAEYTPAAHDITGSGNPFSDADYRLNGANKHDGQALSVDYERDRDGNLRTHWHMGAYE